MRRMIAIIFLTYLFGQIDVAFPSGEEEQTRHTPSVPSWEMVGHQALRQVSWDWKTALDGWNIQFGPGRPGYHGITELKVRRITIWIRPADSPELVAGTIVHELAHAFDWKYLTPALRTQWLVARGLPLDTPWHFPVGRLGSDYLSGEGDFAEAVRWTLQGPRAGFLSCLGLRLNEQQKKLIARGCQGSPPNEAQQALIRQWLAELPRMGRK